MSDAHHITRRFIHGYSVNGQFHVPAQSIRSLYVDQRPANDLAHAIATTHGIRLASTIPEALTDGAGRLAVEGVLLIGEHGNYSRNDRGQVQYPRYEMMEQVISVFRELGRAVPIFSDMHLSYSWPKAVQMIHWASELDFPLLAGSYLPHVWRRPELELPLESPIEDALVTAHGPIEANGFHALEALQAMLERRKGGETGVHAITCLSGRDVWKAADAGRWSWELLSAALSRSETVSPGDVRVNVGVPTQSGPPQPPAALLVEYRDGVRAAVLMLNGHVQDFCFAAKLRGDAVPKSCLFYTPQPPGAKYFDCLVSRIEDLIATRRVDQSIERTLLTTGMLNAVMESRYRRGSLVDTPELKMAYRVSNSHFARGDVAMTRLTSG